MNGELWLETKCEHGESGQHQIDVPEFCPGTQWTCLGGSRRRVTVDYEKAAAKLWEVDGMVDGEWPTLWEPGTNHIRHKAAQILDAALVVDE